MEILALLLIVTMPIAFLIWSLKFKGILALMVIAPVVLLNVFVMTWNSELNGVDVPTLDYTHKVIVNSTETTVLGTATTVNVYDDVTDQYPIPYSYFTLLVIMMYVFTFVMLFVVFRRVVRDSQRSKEEDEG